MIRRYTNIVAVYFILYKNNMFSGNMSTWKIFKCMKQNHWAENIDMRIRQIKMYY